MTGRPRFSFPIVEMLGGFPAVQQVCAQRGFPKPHARTYDTWVSRRALPDAIALWLVLEAVRRGMPVDPSQLEIGPA